MGATDRPWIGHETDHQAYFGNSGLPMKAVTAWHKRGYRPTGNFKIDVAGGSKFWREGASLIAKLPKKAARTVEQQVAANIILFYVAKRAKTFSSITPRRSIGSLQKI